MAQETLEHEDPLHVLAAHLPGVVYTYRHHADGGREVLYLSAGLEILLGPISAAEVGLSFERLRARIHPDDLLTYARAEEVSRSEGRMFDCVARLLSDDGYRWVHAVARVVLLPDGSSLWHGLMLDVDQRRRAEKDLQRYESTLRDAQRLESVGALAGGIAHEFNNLLQTVLGNVGLALTGTAEDDPLREALASARDAALRAADLCRELLNYTGQAPAVARLVDLNALVRDLARLFQVGVPRDAVLTLDLAPGKVEVEADPAQLRQLILNLVTTAPVALAAAGPTRTLTVRTQAAGRDMAPVGYLPGALAMGPWVALEIEDTGRGMDDNAFARAFDPFFSTKRPGRGMGLAASLGIVRAHNGGIRIERRRERGTSVRVLLPAAAPAAATPRAAPRPARDAGRVLIVDDEPAVRRVCEKILGAAGFEVWSAAAGEDALVLVDQGGAVVDVAVLDLTMPRLDGHATLERLRELVPGLPAVLISGYDSSRLSGSALDATTRFLPKPFLPEELVAAVRGALLG
jgi:signal transduction histidine kinase/CheY-like chemotaxis protein